MMNRTRAMSLWIASVVFLIWVCPHGALASLGTAFTYQGRFMDGGAAANDTYDFQFSVYDAVTSGIQQGSTMTCGDIDVNDGYFTVDLDFGSGIFGGDARWLQIAVRDGESTGAYTTLSPRYAITPTAYALYAEKTAGITVSSGKVGIGTSSPVSELDLGGPSTSGGCNFKVGSLEMQSYSTNNSWIADNTYFNGTRFVRRNDGYACFFYFHGREGQWRFADTGNADTVIDDGIGGWGKVVFKANLDGSAALGGDMSNGVGSFDGASLFVNGSGNVGIGTTLPSARLHVTAGAAFPYQAGVFETTGLISAVSLKSSTTTGYGYGLVRINEALDLRTQDVERIVITEDGDVGIGTTSPTVLLDVDGDIRCVDLTETSDAQLKTDVQPLSGVLDKLAEVRAVSFKWNDKAKAFGVESDKAQIGVLAQELEQVFPELVTTPEPVTTEQLIGKYPEEMLTDEVKQRLQRDAERSQYKAVSYSKLTAVLVEAVKELQAENAALQQRVEALEGKAN